MIYLRSSLLSAVAALSVFAASIPPASAAAASTYTVNGNVYRVVEFVGADSNEIRLSTVVKGPAANNPYAARVVPIKQARFAAWFKPNLVSLILAHGMTSHGRLCWIQLAGWEQGACDAAKHKPRAFVRLGLVLVRRVASPRCDGSTAPALKTAFSVNRSSSGGSGRALCGLLLRYPTPVTIIMGVYLQRGTRCGASHHKSGQGALLCGDDGRYIPSGRATCRD